ncbi:MAG: Gfo/Idh/MocA family oxidoreductase [Verrucomicrobiales bacterium]|nr:Gfo/Idh/MocA family oxidoreductase [Verrucomicrobiales bacterium]
MTRRQTLQTLLAASAASATSSLLNGGEPALRIAVIGHTGRGDFGHGLDYLWRGVPQTVIAGVSDPVEEGLKKALKTLRLPEESGFSDYRELLQATSPDIVAVAPRHVDQHAAMAIASCEAGAKGIYIEKPFCRDLGEADRIIAACRENRTKLTIAHRNGYHPVLPVILDLVDEGKIGQLLEIRARGKEDHRGGCQDLWVLGSHLLNLINILAGKPASCTATILADGRPATKADLIEGEEGLGPILGNGIHARYDMENGLPVFFESIAKAGSREAGFGLQLIGTEGIIDLRADREPLAHFRAGNPFNPRVESGAWQAVTSAGIGKAEPIPKITRFVGGHIAAVEDLISAIDEDRMTRCNEEDGRTVVAMIMAAFASHVDGGRRVDFPVQEKQNPLLRLI